MMTIDHDKNFKELISTFFLEFLELFLPQVASEIDPDSIVFLQQEYFADLVEGEEKIVDLLVSVKRSGTDTTFLIHIEAQSSSQMHFNRRLFFYFAILHQRHLQPIYPIVIFSFDTPQRAEPDSYQVTFPDRKVLEFNYATIQLNRLSWRDYIDRPNPVAAALMAKMKIAKADRPRVKAECLRLLVTLRLDPAKTRLVSKFVDTYLRLNTKEERVFQSEVDKMELVQKERIMETLTSWEEKGMEKGMERATQTIALSLLEQNVPLETIAQATKLTIAQLQVLQTQAQRSPQP
jgi:predicted transposase YdaD